MQLRPGVIAMLAGGAVLFISTFLSWVDFFGFTANVYEGDFFGFSGILLLLLSIAIIAVTAIGAFAPQVKLPDEVLGFTMNQLMLTAGFAAFVFGFSTMFRQGSAFGSILAWLAAAAVVVGAVLEEKAAPSAGSEPPRTF